MSNGNPDGVPARKGIVLAGGTGTRLYPITKAVSKQLVPVHDKPMIYYPLSVLMLAGIREVLVITTPHDARAFRNLLGDGSDWGMEIDYAVQEAPNGIAEALVIAEPYLGGAPSALILGDNIFYGNGLAGLLDEAMAEQAGARIFAYRVSDPSRYGVVEFGPDGQVTGLAEKPAKPASPFAMTGLYFYDESAPARARDLRPSERGEIEITDLNRSYLSDDALSVALMGRGYTWLDTGTHAALLDAGNFVRITEERQAIKVCCPEEIAWRKGFIDDDQLARLAEPLKQSGYGHYLLQLLRHELG